MCVGIKRDERTDDDVRATAAPARTPFSSAPYLLRSDEIAKCVGILGFLSVRCGSPRNPPILCGVQHTHRTEVKMPRNTIKLTAILDSDKHFRGARAKI